MRPITVKRNESRNGILQPTFNIKVGEVKEERIRNTRLPRIKAIPTVDCIKLSYVK
ncbi:hypothetical protein [Sulfolobus sp. S-194]|uniref:hypothetical protein n=1 Tax=Sulfolobus sp. S-194 TaxID=2512240 RepID=UPI00143AA4A9|nr:hypothetical protein [Sulfolobus sp. S-194]